VPETLLIRARHVHSGGFYLQERSRDRLPAFFATARARGLTTSFDTNWDPTERWDGGVREMLHAADLVFPNAAEATRIAGFEDPEPAAAALASTGAEGRLDGGPIVAVKRGVRRVAARRARLPFALPRCRSSRSTRPAPVTRSTPVSCARGWTADARLPRAGRRLRALSTRAVGGVDGQPTFAEATARWRPGGRADDRTDPRSSPRTRRSTGCTALERLTVGRSIGRSWSSRCPAARA
jgi:hypothetical protein